MKKDLYEIWTVAFIQKVIFVLIVGLLVIVVSVSYAQVVPDLPHETPAVAVSLPLNDKKYETKYSTSTAETLLIRIIEQNDQIIARLSEIARNTK